MNEAQLLLVPGPLVAAVPKAIGIRTNYKDALNTPEYKKYRDEFLARRNYRCELCGERAGCAHHVRYFKVNGKPDYTLDPSLYGDDELRALCWHDHQQFETLTLQTFRVKAMCYQQDELWKIIQALPTSGVLHKEASAIVQITLRTLLNIPHPKGSPDYYEIPRGQLQVPDWWNHMKGMK